jgi:hypothetical protein
MTERRAGGKRGERRSWFDLHFSDHGRFGPGLSSYISQNKSFSLTAGMPALVEPTVNILEVQLFLRQRVELFQSIVFKVYFVSRSDVGRSIVV